MLETPEILIVDDDETLLGSFRAIAESAGHSVESAVGGRAALTLLVERSLTPKLILLDLEMPGVCGWELISILRSHHRLARISMVVISGANIDPRSLRSVDGYLRKPVAPEELLSEIAKHLRRALAG